MSPITPPGPYSTQAPLRMALAGNPNAGKTTLFNTLTGARQHVGNYPGITVDYKEGAFTHACPGASGDQRQEIILTDLPGTYSLTAYSVEEVVARDYLVNERPQVVINIVDAANLERNLYLTTQFLELGCPLVIALNMMDVARDRGIEIQTGKLAELLGVPVLPIIARSGQGTEALIDQAILQVNQTWGPRDISYGDDLDEVIMAMTAIITDSDFLTGTYPARFTAIKYLEQDEQLLKRGRQDNADIAGRLEKRVAQISEHLMKTLDAYPEAIIADHRYGFIKSILRQGIQRHSFDEDRLHTSDRIDKVLTNRLLGPVIMLLILFGLYQFTFSWSAMPVAALESFFSWLGRQTDALLPDGPLQSMIISGVIDGMGGVLGFVPLIAFMFFGIAALEDSGYLARVAFMMDRVFRIFGLHGSSVMPFIVSGGIAGGCAVPGVMATRTLRSPKERMATLLTVPFMNCGAKVPVIALLIGTFFSDHKALYMFGFTILSWIVALLAAKLLRTTVLRGAATPFVMELPPYRFPTLRGLAIHTWERTWQYIKKAGTVILGISILLWAMMSYPQLPLDQREGFAQQRQALRRNIEPVTQEELLQKGGEEKRLAAEDTTLQKQLTALNQQEAEQALRHSLAGRIGIALEPVSRLAGFDWRTNIALVGGFAAKEVIISTLGTAYSMGKIETEAAESLSGRLLHSPSWNRIVAVSALVFIAFYAPCFVTVVSIAKEAGHWGWAAFSVSFNTLFAFLLATAIYQIGTWLG